MTEALARAELGSDQTVDVLSADVVTKDIWLGCHLAWMILSLCCATTDQLSGFVRSPCRSVMITLLS
jgi:hypothetical protein